MQTYRRYIDKIVAPSKFFLDKFVEWGWPRDRFVHIPNYVDSNAFRPDFTPGKYFLYFGRLAPEKGVSTLIRACAKAKIELKIAGTGPECEALLELNDALDGRVEFLGFRSGDELHDLIRGARAVVLPSEWYENAPMSVLESFALGKPVIGADIGGIPEMIVHGENGWIFPSADVDSLADLLLRVLKSDDAVIEHMGRAARYGAERDFNRSQYTSKVLDLYSKLGVDI